jgi:hypothetical protein
MELQWPTDSPLPYLLAGQLLAELEAPHLRLKWQAHDAVSQYSPLLASTGEESCWMGDGCHHPEPDSAPFSAQLFL